MAARNAPSNWPEPNAAVARRRPLRGRAAEMAVIGELCGGLAAVGAATLVVIEGDAGIGKSRLLLEVSEVARRAGIRWYSANCDPIAHDRPFGPLLEALECERSASDPRRRRVAETAAILCGQASDEAVTGRVSGFDHGARYGVQDELVELLLDDAEECPCLLVIDDAQWIDSATVSAIGATIRRRRGRSIGVVLALRPDSRSLELEALLDRWSEDLCWLRLSPLSTVDVELVSGDVLGDEPPVSLRRSLVRAGGNSFSVVQLTRAFASEGVANQELAGVRSSVIARVKTLGHDATTLLATAAVLGVEFTPDDLCTISGRDPFEVFDILYGAARTGLLVGRGGRFGFSHDLVAELCATELPEPLRRSIHRSIVKNASELDLSPTVLAHHVMASATHGDPTAIDALCRAAVDVGGHDPHLALTFLDVADGLCGEGCDRAVEVALRRAGVLCVLRRAGDAIDILSTALKGAATPSAVVRVRSARARCMHLLGDVSGAADEFEALAMSGSMEPADEASAWADVATYRLWAMQGMRPWREAERAIELADLHGSLAPAVQALAAQSAMAAFDGAIDQALALGEQACARGAALPYSTIIPAPSFSLGVARLIGDELEGAIELLQSERIRIEQLGDPFLSIRPATALSIALYLAGRWDDVEAEADAILGVCDDTGSTVGRLTAVVLHGLVAHHRGRHELADELTGIAGGMSGVGDGYAVPFLLRLQTLRYEHHGDLAGAASLAADTCSLVSALAPAILPWFTLDAVRLAQRTTTVTVESLVDGLADRAATSGRPGPLGMALIAEGAARLDAAMVRRGLDLVAESPQPLHRAMAQELAAPILIAAGDASGAADALSNARRTYDELGAVDLVTRTEPARTRSRTSRVERPRFGWESLTPAELAVVGLLCSGVRNGEIAERLVLSKRTVESHVSSMLVKLGVATRVELANLANRHVGS